MTRLLSRKTLALLALAAGGVAVGLLVPVSAVSAEPVRNPADEAARESGREGEQTDGYLGFPTPPCAEVRRVADDVNIKRRAIYAERAQTNHSTVEDYAFTSACLLILKTKPDEKYQAPDGSWKTRTAENPLRDNRCPAPAGG